ncbi:MAG TPA: twin-arginine translocase TatA/TatE family subunit [Longimicrobiales bacterium]
MPFGNIGPTELIFLLVFLLLIFGAKRLPELGSGLGKGIREFKRSMREINTEIEREEPPPQMSSGARPAVPSATEKKEPSENA